MNSYKFWVYRTGFTLIELLIVVAIIAILAAIAVPNFLEAQTRAKISRNKADMHATATAIETYKIDAGKYPMWEIGTAGNWGKDRGWPFHFWIPSRLTTPIQYINSLPMDPFLSKKIPYLTNHPDWPTRWQFLYKRVMYWSMEYMITTVTPTSQQYANMKRVGGEYILYTAGPDGDFFNTPPGQADSNNRMYRDYDATNGTISLGNIFRTQKNGAQFGTDQYFMTPL